MFSDKTIEEYQLLLMRNPSAKVFAPLAEAYRKMGLLQQALEICERGIKFNPDYPSGLVAYGKILFEMKKYEEASHIFDKATNLKKDNILAHKLKALSLIKINRYDEALQAYKHVLFLNPQDEQAQKFIANWESLEAPKYSAATFAPPQTPSEDRELVGESTNPSHVTHFIEALLARNELDRARSITETSLQIWPENRQLRDQLKMIQDYAKEESTTSVRNNLETNLIKKKFLNRVLRRIELVKNIDQ